MHYLYLDKMRINSPTIEQKIMQSELNPFEWKKAIKYLIILWSIVYLLVGCNVGLKNTSCPSHNVKWYAGKQKYYKH